MPYCPKCHSEYREGIARCKPCDAELLAALPELDAAKSEKLRDSVKAGTAAAIVRASYTEACQMVETLQANGVDAMVSGDPKTCGKHGNCSHFFVAVLPEDAPGAAEVLKSEWKRLVDAEEDAAPADPEAAVDFDAEGAHTCPACGGNFEGAPDECPECGLYLGVG